MPLKIHIPKCDDLWDEASERFITTKEVDLSFEHSLVSISKWEMKWKRAFLSPIKLTDEQILDYIERCMIIGGNTVDKATYRALFAFPDKVVQIKEYMEDPMTATTFIDRRSAVESYKNRQTTSEEIYYLMAVNNIPIEFQKWHLNRLLTLLKVFEVKSQPTNGKNRRSNSAIMKDYAAINRANRAKFNTKG